MEGTARSLDGCRFRVWRGPPSGARAWRGISWRASSHVAQPAGRPDPQEVALGVDAGRPGRWGVPISPAVRRVPALWTMLTQAHRRVVVLGWWGSWLAEAVNGMVASDRAARPAGAGVAAGVTASCG